LVSFLIVTYNQEQYINEAIQSVFSQSYSPMEIIISDDCSSDNTFNIIKSLVKNYNGPNKVKLFQNKKNLGLSANLSNAIKNSTGEFLILMAGDDISLSERTSILVKRWLDSNRSCLAFFSNVEIIDSNSISKGLFFDGLPDYSQDINMIVRKNSFFDLRPVVNCWMLGCSAAIDRRLVDNFNVMNSRILQEDMVFPFRAVLLGRLEYLDLVLLKYRKHESNLYDEKSMEKSMKLIRNSFFIKMQWLEDSFKVSNIPLEVKFVLIKILSKNFIYHLLFNTPFIGVLFYRILNRNNLNIK
jgi:glycosyltransferase involved in cell wall biosynthesis